MRQLAVVIELDRSDLEGFFDGPCATRNAVAQVPSATVTSPRGAAPCCRTRPFPESLLLKNGHTNNSVFFSAKPPSKSNGHDQLLQQACISLQRVRRLPGLSKIQTRSSPEFVLD